MKKLIAMLLALALVFGLVACGGKTEEKAPEAAAPAEKKAEGSVYWLNFKPESDEALKELGAMYEAETGVPVKVVTAASGTYEQTLTSQIDKSDAPTLIVVGNAAAVKNWGDYCYDLTGTPIANELATDAYNMYTADGKLGAIGYCYECFGIIVNVALLEQLGTNFGMDNYSMWFNGAYLLTTYEPQSKRIYTKNENNWDADRVYIERIEETYNTEAATIAPELFLRGEIDSATLSSDIAAEWLADPAKSQNVCTMRLIGDYSFFITLNFEPTFDKEYEPENWGKAVNNENFRKAIFHGFDNITYIAARYPGDDPETHKSTAITPTGFSVNNGKG